MCRCATYSSSSNQGTAAARVAAEPTSRIGQHSRQIRAASSSVDRLMYLGRIIVSICPRSRPMAARLSLRRCGFSARGEAHQDLHHRRACLLHFQSSCLSTPFRADRQRALLFLRVECARANDVITVLYRPRADRTPLDAKIFTRIRQRKRCVWRSPTRTVSAGSNGHKQRAAD